MRITHYNDIYYHHPCVAQLNTAYNVDTDQFSVHLLPINSCYFHSYNAHMLQYHYHHIY